MTLLERPLPARPLPERPLATRPLPPRRLPDQPLPGPVATPAQLTANASLAWRVDVNPTLARFGVRLDESLAGYRPGQYVALGVLADDVIVQRPYSIVATAADGLEIELFIRRVAGGALSERLWQLTPGTRMRVGPPRGLFVADPSDQRRLYVGSGTGVAPLLAMIGQSVAAGDGMTATLIHGVSYLGEHAYTDRLERWRTDGLALDYRPTVSRPGDPRNAGWSGRIGRVEEQLALLAAEPAFAASALTAYLCGNAPMVDACTRLLVGLRVPANRIRTERF